MRHKFVVVDISKLKMHEAFQEEILEKCIRELRNDGVMKYPILVDEEYLVVLDGHHRVEALRRMGYTKIPVYLVDYWDPAIEVTTWEEAETENLTKEMVMDMGRSENVFPAKTSRHIVKVELEEHPVPLEELK